MFTEITNPANPLRTELFLRPYKRGEKEFTPEVARQVLTMTNHPKNISDTLQLIAEQQNQTPYKDIILSAFDHREQPADIIILGKKLAIANGFEDELNSMLAIASLIYASSATNPNVYVCTDERPDLSTLPQDTLIFFNNDILDLSGQLQCGRDNDALKSAVFKEGIKLNLSDNKCLPQNLDVYIAKCDEVDLSHSTLRYYIYSCGQYFNHSLLAFKEGSRVNLSGCEALPWRFDISKCAEVNFSNTNLRYINDIVCGGNANFENATLPNLSLDVSQCDTVNLKNVKITDFNRNPTIIFKNKQQMKESGFTKPKNWRGKITYTEETSIFSSLLGKIKSHNR